MTDALGAVASGGSELIRHRADIRAETGSATGQGNVLRELSQGGEMAQGETLPDLLADDLDVVFIGSAASATSAQRGHYYSHPTNSFWRLLYDAGFTPFKLRPDQDAEVLHHGIGISDLVKDAAQSNDAGLNFSKGGAVLARVASHAPCWIAFNGIGVGKQAAKHCGASTKSHGRQRWTINGVRAFVLPSSSSANSRAVIEGKTKLEWWSELHELIRAP